MNTQDKKLLLKDLCARLPYRAKIHCATEKPFHILQCIFVDAEDGHIDIMDDCGLTFNIKDVKPYLRPMSSMTEEEKKIYNGFVFSNDEYGKICKSDNVDYLHDWLNANYFDYRELILKGLALVAPEGMYNFK